MKNVLGSPWKGRIMNDNVIALLEESRSREKEQALFYRLLAAEAGTSGSEGLADRFNDLHADEQHHVSRLTARIFEMSGTPAQAPRPSVSIPDLDAWEEEARSREEREVAWYREVLSKPLDDITRGIVEEILASEEHHARKLAGKWMSA